MSSTTTVTVTNRDQLAATYARHNPVIGPTGYPVACMCDMVEFEAGHTFADHLADVAASAQLIRPDMDPLETVRAAVYLTPCHVTGMHTPEHHLNGTTCDTQRAEILARVLQVLEMPLEAAPHKLHDACYWCHGVPNQEEFRAQRRATYEWADLPIPAELAAPAPDAPANR